MELNGTRFPMCVLVVAALVLVTFSGPAWAANPDASFTYEPTDPVAGEVVQFTDTSTGEDIDSWEWDFDDDNTSTEQNPTHIFDEEGHYQVKLTVSNPDGDSDVIETVDVSAAVEAPDANFTYEPADPVAGEEVQFTDTSTGGAIESWEWDFDDDDTSTQQNPTHTFDEDGHYTVHLLVTNSAGSSDRSEVIDVGGGGGGEGGEGYLISAASQASGAQGSFWQTDVDVNNTGDDSIGYYFAWFPRSANNSDPTLSDDYTLGPGKSARFENILGEVFGLGDGVNGAVGVIAARDRLIVNSRTFNQGDIGTFGQAIAGVPEIELIEEGQTWRITFMSENADFRANLGCASGVDKSIEIMMDLYDESGDFLETMTMNLPPLSNKQVNQIFGPYSPVNGYVDVYSDTAGARYYCYGSVLDNGSSDPTTVVPVKY